MSGRARGGGGASGAGRRRGGAQPSPARPRRTISAEDRERIERRLTDLPLDRGSLQLAMQPFGANFDLASFVASAAREDQDPVERNKVRLVKSNVQALIDNMVELVRLGATVTELKPRNRPWHQTNSDINAVREDGGLTGREGADLITLKLLADRLRHEYMVLSPEELHAAVNLALGLLPGFTRSYTQWLKQYGIVI